MSLLLDARKKSQQENSHATSVDELRLEDHAPKTGGKSDHSDYSQKIEAAARSAGQKLFSAKAPLPPPGRSLPNPKLLLALGGTILLLAVGGGYLWYSDSSGTPAPRRPISMPPVPQPAAAQPVSQSALISGIGTQAASPSTPIAALPTPSPEDALTPPRAARMSEPLHQNYRPIKIEQQERIEQIDPLLRDAYSAYQSGRLDEAQQLYLALFKKDAHNPDALLGLATIAQQRGENQTAAQYYARILELDPRNADANAGMSALSADDERNESRLKTLLREQGNSAALHFALGNLYAGQSRWGEAQQAYFGAYALESGNAEFAFNLAVSLDHLGQRKLAAQHYQRALQLDPSHSAGFDHAQTSQRVQELAR